MKPNAMQNTNMTLCVLQSNSLNVMLHALIVGLAREASTFVRDCHMAMIDLRKTRRL